MTKSHPRSLRDFGLRPYEAALLAVVLLFSLIPLHDSRRVDPQSEYHLTRQLFLRGHVEASEIRASQNYDRFRTSSPQWAAKFRLLEAESMVSRGRYQDALSVFATLPVTPAPSDAIEKLAYQASALAHMQQYSAADASLTEAEHDCRQWNSVTCGSVLRARGVLAVEQEQFVAAQRFFAQSLDFARLHHDPWLEASALSNLGAASLNQEHYDEAADWSMAAYKTATAVGAEDLAQRSLGNLGWAFYSLGDSERSLECFLDAEKRAVALGDLTASLNWLTTAGVVYQERGELTLAINAFQQALVLAKQINSKDDIVNTLEDLAQLSVQMGKLNEAETYIDQVSPLVRASGNRVDALDVMLAQARIAAARHQERQAESIFREIERDRASQISMKLDAEHELALLYEHEGDQVAAERMYRTALSSFESARDQLKNEDSKIPFVANATDIYDDYIHFLVAQGKTDQALRVADQSRAKTLAQGLGVTDKAHRIDIPGLRPTEVARKQNATLLFYWLGDNQSYLWAINPQKVALFPLPAAREIAPLVERYRKTLLGIGDPAETSDADGVALYRTLVAPAVQMLPANGNVVILSDGPLSQLNFETLIVPAPRPHYWIEDASIVSAPSLHVLAAAGSAQHSGDRLLLIGDAVSPNPDYPELPEAGPEMREIQKRFAPQNEVIFSRQKATSAAYLRSNPQQFSYIHFVAHGVASRTDPLDSAIILSRSTSAEDSFKLHAREIIQHPIHARLVTISACYGSGARSYAGEGSVGLAWAFLHAGAHNVIGALWEVSDESTPQLMGNLYRGLEQGLSPGAALRQSKLALLHSRGQSREPFYWAPFQLYTGR